MRTVSTIEDAAKYPGYVLRRATAAGSWELFYPGDVLPSPPVIYGDFSKALPSDPGVSLRRFGATGDGVTDDTAAVQAAINYAAKCFPRRKIYAEEGIYKISLVTYSTPLDLVAYSNSFGICGAGKSRTVFIGRLEFYDDTYEGKDRELTLSGFSVKQSPGHGIVVRGFYGAQIDDVAVIDCAYDGLRLESTYVTRISRFFASGNSQAADGYAAIRFSRTTSGNSLYIAESYLSGPAGCDGVRTDHLQNLSIRDTTMESLRVAVNVGSVGYTTRTVSLSSLYFENIKQSCIEMRSVYGVTAQDVYINHQGTRSAVVMRSFLFESCDFIKLLNVRFDFPSAQYSNSVFLAPVEFVTYGNRWINAKVSIENCSNMRFVCLDLGADGRVAVETTRAAMGIDGLQCEGVIADRTAPNLLDTDVSLWSKTTAGLSGVIDPWGFYGVSNTLKITASAAGELYAVKDISVSVLSDICFAVAGRGIFWLKLMGRRVSNGQLEDIAPAQQILQERSNSSDDTFRVSAIVGRTKVAYDRIYVAIYAESGKFFEIGRTKLVIDTEPGKL